jgi:hypothetical protein
MVRHCLDLYGQNFELYQQPSESREHNIVPHPTFRTSFAWGQCMKLGVECALLREITLDI